MLKMMKTTEGKTTAMIIKTMKKNVTAADVK